MLDKLYITPRQWLRILRWTLYALVFFLALLVQTTLLGNTTRPGLRPDLIAVVISCVCLREGPERGGLFALLASFFWYLTGADLASVSIAVMTLVPVLGCIAADSWFNRRFLPCLAVTVLTVLTHRSVIFLLKYFFEELPAALFAARVLPCVPASAAVQPLVYLLVRAVSRIGDAYEPA